MDAATQEKYRSRHRLLLLATLTLTAACAAVKTDGLASKGAGADGAADDEPLPTAAGAGQGSGGAAGATHMMDAAPPIVIDPARTADAGAADRPAGDDARRADTAPARDTAADSGPLIRPDATAARPARAILLTSIPTADVGDVMLKARLAGLGYQVTVAVVTNVDNMRAARKLAADQDLLVVSSSFLSTVPESGIFVDLPVPILCLEQALLAGLEMVQTEIDSSGWFVNQTKIEITMPRHPLAGGTAAGLVTVVNGFSEMGWGRPLPSATVVATLAGGPDQGTIFAYDKGTQLVRIAAPARRVAWFGHVLTLQALNAQGWSLFDAAVTWAANLPPR